MNDQTEQDIHRSSPLPAIWLGLVIANCFLFFLSKWAVNADALGKQDLGIALAAAFYFAASIYVDLVLLAISAGGFVLSWRRKRKSTRLFAWSTGTALLPLAYLLYLDIG